MCLQEQPMGAADPGAPAAVAWPCISVCTGALQMSASSPSAALVQRAEAVSRASNDCHRPEVFSVLHTAALVLQRALKRGTAQRLWSQPEPPEPPAPCVAHAASSLPARREAGRSPRGAAVRNPGGPSRQPLTTNICS